jgi:hypothetical protein
MKINLRQFSRSVSDGFAKLGRGATRETVEVEVSWPTNVVKTVECGQDIERPMAIHNPHERLQPHELLQQQYAAKTGISWPNSVSKNPGNAHRENMEVLDGADRGHGATVKLVPAEDTAAEETVVKGEINNTATDDDDFIGTASVADWISEPRGSWQQTSPRKLAQVSKIQRAQPTIHQPQPHQNRPAQNISRHVHLAPHVIPEPARFDAPRPFPSPLGVASPLIAFSSKRNDYIPRTTNPASVPIGPISPDDSGPPESDVPNPIAVKRESWHVSTEAASTADHVRAENRYSFHGAPFKDLRPLKTVTDPEILRKMADIRLKNKEEQDDEVARKVEEKKRILRDGGVLVYDERTLRRMEEIRHVNISMILLMIAESSCGI